MAKFILPPISPLIGASLGTFVKVTWRKPIKASRWLHIVLSFITIVLILPFQIPDILYFKRKLKSHKPKTPPIFILGHWRSGTTFLHNTLTKDHRASYVTTYHSVFPNHLRVKSFFEIFMSRIMPEKRPGDEVKLNVNFPQEDEYALSNMTPCSFYHFFYFPHAYRKYYNKYVRFADITPATVNLWTNKYTELVHKACINTGGDMAILKNPLNTGRIPELLELFPNARFIHIVRNPVFVYCSTKKFFLETIKALSFQKFTAGEISDMIFWLYENLMNDYLKDKDLIPEQNFYEIKYEKLIANPLNEVGKIYDQLNLNGNEQDKADIIAYLKTQKFFKTGKYTITKRELDTILDRWGFAMNTWNYQVPDNIRVVDG